MVQQVESTVFWVDEGKGEITDDLVISVVEQLSECWLHLLKRTTHLGNKIISLELILNWILA